MLNPEQKSSPKRKPAAPCGRCFLRQDLCLCELIPELETRSRLCLVVHYKELKRTSNTGRLAVEALTNSEMRVRGQVSSESMSLVDLVETSNYQPLLLYPSEGSVVLNKGYLASFTKPIQLIVPDGNWRQASKVNTRYPELAEVPRVHIEAKNQDMAYMRLESVENGMATLQAIAHAFGVLEGEPVRERLLSLYQEKLERTLFARGQLSESNPEKNDLLRRQLGLIS